MQRNTVGHLVAMAFLFTLASAKALSNSLVALANESRTQDIGSITLQPYELFARRDIGGQGGIFEFVNNTVDKAQGICNFDKGKLPSNEAFIFNEVSINFALGDENKAGGVSYTGVAPDSLRNAEFEIKQNGRSVLSVPLASLHNPFEDARTSQEGLWTKLNSLCYLADDTDFTWSIKFANGESVAAGVGAGTFPYCEVRLRGHRTIKRPV